ncbi:hypothetical protein B0T09DRAFT_408447, partial [Sordaria sp. MPI-SDFR-AT-0083]
MTASLAKEMTTRCVSLHRVIGSLPELSPVPTFRNSWSLSSNQSANESVAVELVLAAVRLRKHLRTRESPEKNDVAMFIYLILVMTQLVINMPNSRCW